MVAPTVRYFWQKPVTCDARRLLYAAETSLERGSTIEAGCKLREALRSFLHAECEYHGCLPKQKRPPSARVLAQALKRAGHCPPECYATVVDVIHVSNDAAHLVIVKPGTISAGICFVHRFLDLAPYLIEAKKGGRS